ncbi:MAG: hypothetical protein HYZ27_03550, partial [Deltaproteobacteria bacterium]|nr:hypothetical protein [Deltaproteobacteria bacterium]
LVSDRLDRDFSTGDVITVPLFTNRLRQLHNWTATFASLPNDSDAVLINAKRSGTTLNGTPQVASCLRQNSAGNCTELNSIRFEPDEPGTYKIRVNAELPLGDAMGTDVATYTIVAEVGGEGQGGCAAGAPTGLAALVVGLFAALRRRRV